MTGVIQVNPGHHFELSSGGTLAGVMTFEGGGTFDWSGGTISASLTVAENSQLNVGGPYRKSLQSESGLGRVFTRGASFIAGSGEILFVSGETNAPVLCNEGWLTISASASLTDANCCVTSKLIPERGKSDRRHSGRRQLEPNRYHFCERRTDAFGRWHVT